jgi:hypothetical protein
MADNQAWLKKLSDPVFTAIEERLQKRYKISLQKHMNLEEVKGTIDPSMGGRIPQLKNSLDVTLAPFLLVGGTVLQGVTFQPANFQALFTAIKEASNSKGENAFHLNRDKDSLLANILQADLLAISYQQTTVGRSKQTETKAISGFREIADSYNVTIGPVEASKDPTVGPTVADKVDRDGRKYGLSTKTYARRIDITSLHVALNPGACNIHIDDVGFVLRGPQGAIGLDPDFLQHLVNELLLKSKLREKFVAKYGESSDAVWAVDHISVVLPSSDVGYMPMVGAKLETEKLAVSAALSFDCKCLPEGRAEMEERFAPRKSGVTFGLGLEVRW